MASNLDSCNCGRMRVGRLLGSSRSPDGALEHLLEASLQQEANPQKFLDALELLSVVQQVEFADRRYRQSFTENYRVLFQKSKHLYRLELWEACQDNFESVAVNGRIYVINAGTRLKAAHVRRCHQQLLTKLGQWRPSGSQRLLEQLSPLLARFDQVWTDFEGSYVVELMSIEVEARKPMERAVKLERQLQFFDVASISSRPKTRRSPDVSEEVQLSPAVRRLSLASSDSASAESVLSSCWEPRSRPTSEAFGGDVVSLGPAGSMASSERGGDVPAMARAIRDQSEEARDLLTALCQEVSGLNACANLHGHGRDDMTEEVLVAAASLLLRGGSDAEATVRRFLASKVLESFAAVRSYLASISNFVMEVDPQLACNAQLVKALSSWEEAWELGERLLLNEGMLQALSTPAALCAAPGAPDTLLQMLEDQDAELFLVLPRLVLLCSLSDERNAEVLRNILPGLFVDARFGERLQELQARLQELQAEAEENLVVPLALHQSPGQEDHHGSFLRTLEGLSMELQRSKPSEWNQYCMVLLQCIEVARAQSLP